MNPDDLKTALANVLESIRKSKREQLTAALGSELDKLLAGAAAIGGPSGELLAALSELARPPFLGVDVPPEKLERILDLVEQAARRGRPGRPPKDLSLAVAEAQTVAAVDALMASKDLGLDRACREVAKKTGGHFGWKSLKTLRANILRVPPRASTEVVECYRWQTRTDHYPFTDEVPATMTLEVVQEIWAHRAQKT